MSTENCILIMAGGKGTRFWPKSTEEKPKQFINLIDNKTMIQLTIDRIRKLLPIEKIFVVTGEKYVDILKNQIPDLPNKNIIMEPVGRNTASCILLSSIYIRQIYGDCNVAVLPSDHLIKNEEKFIEVLNLAFKFVKTNKNAIVTVGMTPDRPEIGYGYIKLKNNKINNEIEEVDKFVEKPDLRKAKEYLESKQYLWNAGMFVFDTNNLLNQFNKYYNYTYNLLNNLPKIDSENYKISLKEIYPKCDNISMDYAIMEKANNIYVIPAEFGWDDIGTWKSLERYIKKDENGNILKGNNIDIFNTNNCVIYEGNKRIVLINVKDLYVIEGDDTIVVCNKNDIEKVKKYKLE